ncbi:MAG: LacI family DNA-binding transcriptional regulator [Lachnospiraceae bacterium]|nr:LacI family DNA-binding transcriptional regulator [Lachnospiraceae bacterium]
MGKRTTISDVAEKAQVSLGTVHRAIYGKPGVSDLVRQRILEIAHEMGYQPNRVASSLRKKPLNIVVAFPAPTEANRFFYGELWNGCKDCAELTLYHNCSIIEVPFEEDRVNSFAANMVKVLMQYQDAIDGILIGGKMLQEDIDLAATITQPPHRIPLIAVGENFENIDCLCSIQSDHVTDGRMAAELLCAQLEPGRDILIAAGDPLMWSNDINSEAFCSQVKEISPQRTIHVVKGAAEDTTVTSRVRACIEQNPTIGGMYSVNARGTLQLVDAVRALGLEGKIKIIGSDLYRESAQLLREGIIHYIIYKNPRNQARTGIQYMLDHLIWGTEPDTKDQRLTSLIVCRSNVDKYYTE